ncbi:hypothetical protein CCR85_01270 [Rhodothalassium salexigens]|uniref:major capsid protein n=1 Tax=Rhodothalassium salexigens TaxID=1086 RepID=UPI0019134E31|nr:major capsid protein [Rhodothalassium salexigens]MBK5910123.1 hypothetical protein [Rhodothalassium salexigens]MBK5920736.1 hypothetical protein [Rhodothalassium salexigens]
MEIIDAFEGTFTNSWLAQTVDRVPYRPQMVGSLLAGSIEPAFPTTSAIQVEIDRGRIGVLSTQPRHGAPQVIADRPRGAAFPLGSVHIPATKRLYADQVQDRRRPGEAQLQTLARVVNDTLAAFNADYDLTFEMHRIGMLKGRVLDTDGSTLFDFFDRLDVAQQSVDFKLSAGATKLNGLTRKVKDKIDDALGGLPYDRIGVIAGRDWYDAFVEHDSVADTFKNHAAARVLREDPSSAPFAFGSFDDIRRYRDTAAAGLPDRIAPDEAYAVPLGVAGMFRVYWTPAGTFDSVNTPGRRLSITRGLDRDHGRWVDMVAESNPIWLNTHPQAVIKLTKS